MSPDEDAPPSPVADFASLLRDIFWELDGALRFTWVSDRIERLAGITPDDAIGKPP